MNIATIEEKRKYLLDLLEKPEDFADKQSLNFAKFTGSGTKRKIQRLIFAPEIYLKHLEVKFLRRIGINPKKHYYNVNLYGLKNIRIKEAESNLNNDLLPLFFAEYNLTKFFVKNLKENDIFYDIGANYGFYTHLALEFCKEVHSFEPQPDEFENLSNNLKDDKRVFLNNVALSNNDGITKLLLAEESSSIISEIQTELSKEFKQKIEVKTITLDDYLKTHNKPSILKIDVEGAENLVLEGGKEFFKNNSPVIAMEVWGDYFNNGKNKNHKSAVKFLKDLGYKCYKINDDGELNLINEPDYQNLETYGNFVFKK